MSYLDILKPQLVIDEGERNKMYVDSLGIPTIGIGHNLRDKPISKRDVQVIFEDDVADAEVGAKRLIANFDSLSDVRKSVIINMVFNLGSGGVSLFKNTIAAINEERFTEAAEQMLNSTWAAQVGDRAKRLAKQMKEG